VEARFLSGKLARSFVTQTAVRPFFVVLRAPGRNLPPRFETSSLPKLFLHATVKILDARVLRRLAWLYVRHSTLDDDLF
jgi:hypothetical protein